MQHSSVEAEDNDFEKEQNAFILSVGNNLENADVHFSERLLPSVLLFGKCKNNTLIALVFCFAARSCSVPFLVIHKEVEQLIMCEKCDIDLQLIFKDNVACIECIVGPSCRQLPGEKTYDVVLILCRMFDSPWIRCCSLIAFLSEWNTIFQKTCILSM